MRRRHHYQYRGLTDGNVSHPMDQRDSTDGSPPLAQFGRDRLQRRKHGLLKCLVDQRLHAIAALRMVAGRAGEHHDGATRWNDRPVVGLTHVEWLVGQLDQSVSTVDELARIHDLSVSQ